MTCNSFLIFKNDYNSDIYRKSYTQDIIKKFSTDTHYNYGYTSIRVFVIRKTYIL